MSPQSKLLFTYSYGDESFGLVYEDGLGRFDVYSIQQYGGEERYEDTFIHYDKAVEYASSFT